MKLSTAARNASVAAVLALVDAGPGAGTLKFYTGSQPANPQTAPSGTLLATLTFSDPAFGAPSTGTATANAITSDTAADASGTAGWARIADSTGATVKDVTVGTSGTDITFASVTWNAGDTIAMSSLTYAQPE